MAISDVQEYTHLTTEEVEQLGRELDAIRAEVETSRSEKDAAYIRKVIAWTLPTNGGEVLGVLIAVLLGIALPMSAAQILCRRRRRRASSRRRARWSGVITRVQSGAGSACRNPREDHLTAA